MEEDSIYENDTLFYNHPEWQELVKAAMDGNFSKLSEERQFRYLLGILYGMVGNGGSQHWYDTSGEFAVETAAMLRSIQAAKTADLLEAINGLFPDGRPAKDGDERCDQMFELQEKSEEFVEMCEAFDDYLLGNDLLEENLDEYTGIEDPVALFVEYLEKRAAE